MLAVTSDRDAALPFLRSVSELIADYFRLTLGPLQCRTCAQMFQICTPKLMATGYSVAERIGGSRRPTEVGPSVSDCSRPKYERQAAAGARRRMAGGRCARSRACSRAGNLDRVGMAHGY